MADKFFEERQPAAVLKHELLSRYLPVFVRKTGSTSKDRRVAYIDGYAGPGVYEDGSPGSPAVAVETTKTIRGVDGDDRIDGYFVERDATACKALRAYLAAEGLSWQVYQGDVVDHLDAILRNIDSGESLFAFLDPFGLGIPLDMIHKSLLTRGGRMAGNWRVGGVATEVLLNFSFPGLRRNAGHLLSTSTKPSYLRARAKILDRVDASLGGDWWREVWVSEDPDREAEILDGYLRRLSKLPGGWGWWSVPVADRWEGPPSYNLILLTQHRDGLWHFNEALSNALEPYRRFCVQQAGELDLDPLSSREQTWVAEIKANIERVLGTGRALRVGDDLKVVYGEALAFAREKHVRAAIKQLHKEGKTPTTGVGPVYGMVVKPPAPA